MPKGINTIIKPIDVAFFCKGFRRRFLKKKLKKRN
jgi:hypothetical protein